MGRFLVRGPGAVPFLRRILTNDAGALPVGRSHYTLLANENGGAIDDAYLYRFVEDEFLLVVNAANRSKDWDHITGQVGTDRVALEDVGERLCMISLQGPTSQDLLGSLLDAGVLPEPKRNALSTASIAGVQIMIGRTGYTGEPLCFEFFAPVEHAGMLWERLRQKGAEPIGLGARDTLRLEAALPLYGHEQGVDPDGDEIPLLSCPVADYGVSLSPLRGNLIGGEALARQQEARRRLISGDDSMLSTLPRTVRPVAVTGRGIARAGSLVMRGGRSVGWVTSGTMVPYWRSLARGLDFDESLGHDLRSICLAYLDSGLSVGEALTIEIRGKRVDAVVVERHLRSDSPPYSRPLLYGAD
jgi:aminomethyltransferase